MDDTDISPYITLTKVRSGERLQIEQKYVKIREGQNKVMAVSYQAPIYEIIELERFFENFPPSEKIKFNICRYPHVIGYPICIFSNSNGSLIS